MEENYLACALLQVAKEIAGENSGKKEKKREIDERFYERVEERIIRESCRQQRSICAFGVTNDHNEHTCLCLLRSLCLPPPNVYARCEASCCFSNRRASVPKHALRELSP